MLHLNPFITFYLCFLAIVLGTCMGSFLNCLAIRLVKGESIAKGKSHCMSCGHELKAKDLIPVVSYLSLKGKCRYCGKKMSHRYLISEIVAGLVFLSVLLKFDVSLDLLQYLLLASVLLCISFADLEEYIIPDCLIIAGIVIRLVFVLAGGNILKDLTGSIIGGLAVSVPVLLIVLIAEKVMKKEAMGGGDIKLLFMTGLYFNWKVNIFALIAACVFGIIFGVISQKRAQQESKKKSSKKKKHREEESKKLIPFGPAISCGFWAAMLFGSECIAAYLSLF